VLPTVVKSIVVFIISCSVLVIFNQSGYGNCYEGYCINAAISKVWVNALIISVIYGIYSHANRPSSVPSKKNITKQKVEKQVSPKRIFIPNAGISASKCDDNKGTIDETKTLDTRPSVLVKSRLKSLQALKSNLPESIPDKEIYPLIEHSVATLKYLNEGYYPLTVKVLKDISWQLNTFFLDEHEVLLCHLELGWGKLITISHKYMTVKFKREQMKMQNSFGEFLIFGLVHKNNKEVYIQEVRKISKEDEWQVPSYNHR
jgi:hypothetical protein